MKVSTARNNCIAQPGSDRNELGKGATTGMNSIYIPAKSPEDWRLSLAEPDRQWKTGSSAKTLAYCWHAADGFPACVSKAFDNSGSATFRQIEPLLIIPEHKVDIPCGSAASQNDIFVLAKSADQLITITVEGKVNEPFDKTVSEWFRNPSSGKQKCLEFLCSELNLPVDTVMDIPYQLLHRTVSAKLSARQFQAGIALMLVHSFSPKDMWFEEYAKFAALFGVDAEKDKIYPAQPFDWSILYLGWAKGDPEYLCK